MLDDPCKFYFLILGFLYFPVDGWRLTRLTRTMIFRGLIRRVHILGSILRLSFLVTFLHVPQVWANNRAQELLPKMEKIVQRNA